MVQRDGERGRRRTASLALRTFRPLHRVVQGHRGDCARLSPSGVLVADGDAYYRARRGWIAAGGGGAHALLSLGGIEENRRAPLEQNGSSRSFHLDRDPRNWLVADGHVGRGRAQALVPDLQLVLAGREIVESELSVRTSDR